MGMALNELAHNVLLSLQHADERQSTTAAARFGIRSFVYSRRCPFHPQRYATAFSELQARCRFVHSASSTALQTSLSPYPELSLDSQPNHAN